MSAAKRSGARLAVPVIVALVAAVLLPQLLGGPREDASRAWPVWFVEPFVATSKIASLFGGAWYAARSAVALGRGNPARAAWVLFAGWLLSWGVGQVLLSAYPILLGRTAPLPSAGDAFFMVGYALMVSGEIRFLQVYGASGIPVGVGYRSRAAALSVLIAVAAGLVLRALAQVDTPLGAQVVTMGYPVLDFMALVPAMLLLRMTLRFRPGRVWTVWAALLAGIVFAAGGDIVFAYFAALKDARLGTLVDLTLFVSYFLAAAGARRQHELATE